MEATSEEEQSNAKLAQRHSSKLEYTETTLTENKNSENFSKNSLTQNNLNEDKIQFWAQYSFRHDPFLKFTADKSKYHDAVKFGMKEVNYILKNFLDGLNY